MLISREPHEKMNPTGVDFGLSIDLATLNLDHSHKKWYIPWQRLMVLIAIKDAKPPGYKAWFLAHKMTDVWHALRPEGQIVVNTDSLCDTNTNFRCFYLFPCFFSITDFFTESVQDKNTPTVQLHEPHT